MNPFNGWLALVRLTILEMMRQRLWIFILVATAVLLLVMPSMGAVDEAARMKLAVVAITGTVGFMLTLLAVLVGASILRRDLDHKVGYTLFTKPVGRAAYVLGRWTGVQIGLFLGVVILLAVGSAVIALQLDRSMEVRHVTGPVAWYEKTFTGETRKLSDRAENIRMSPGRFASSHVQWEFADLPTTLGDDEHLELLLRANVYRHDLITLRETEIQVQAYVDNDRDKALEYLPRDPDSPFGAAFSDGGEQQSDYTVVLRGSARNQNDLSQDYARLQLSGRFIDDQGRATVIMHRLRPNATVTLFRDSSVFVAEPGGGFFFNALRGGVVQVAMAGVLCSFCLLLASVSKIGVVLLGGLTLYFVGHCHFVVEEVLRLRQFYHVSDPMVRLLELGQTVFPDFQRFRVPHHLATSEAISWGMMAEACAYYGLFTVIFLVLAWLSLVRREL